MNAKTLPTSPESIQICALYDATTGRIAHIHRVATFAGAKKTSQSKVEARCLEMAKKLGHNPASMKTLHISSAEFKSGTPYRVDVHSRKLIEVPRRSLSQMVAK
jgi:hypothetical protein